MKLTRLIPALVITAACALGAVPAASAATADVQQASSANWSGYVAGTSSSGTRFRSVSGSWVAPAATCSGSSTYSAYWVGLGGAGDTEALEQAGTEANCDASGQASYYAWYELVPSAPVRVDLGVHAGDHISTKVTVEGTTVDVSVANTTTGHSSTRSLTMDSPDVSSAEWIAEAPSSCDAAVSICTPLPLTDFGSVTFTSAAATTTGGHTGPISDARWSAVAVSLTPGAGSSGIQGVELSPGASSASATPSPLSSDGSSFSVAYSADGSSTTDGRGGSSSGYGYGYGGGAPSGGYGYGYGYGYDGGGYGYGDDPYGG